MRTLSFVFCCIAGLLVVPASQAQSWGPTALHAGSLPRPAIDGAKAWLKLFDAGNIDQSWSQSGAYFQAHVSKAQLAETAKQDRWNFGPAIYRSFLYGEKRGEMYGTPAGQYLLLHFRTEGSRHGSTETVTMMMQDGTWQVAGYYASGPNGIRSVTGLGALPMHWD